MDPPALRFSGTTGPPAFPPDPFANRDRYPQTAAYRLYKDRGEQSVLSPPKAAQPSSPSYFGGGLGTASIVPPPRRRASPSLAGYAREIGWVFSTCAQGRRDSGKNLS
jgi:hypothetical protein